VDSELGKENTMKEALHTFTNRNARWRFTHSIGFKLGMGCLSLLCIAACAGTLLLINFWPGQ
jgi:uncharacterized membrane protein